MEAMTASLCPVLNDATNYNDDVNQMGFPSNKTKYKYKTDEIIFRKVMTLYSEVFFFVLWFSSLMNLSLEKVIKFND